MADINKLAAHLAKWLKWSQQQAVQRYERGIRESAQAVIRRMPNFLVGKQVRLLTNPAHLWLTNKKMLPKKKLAEQRSASNLQEFPDRVAAAPDIEAKIQAYAPSIAGDAGDIIDEDDLLDIAGGIQAGPAEIRVEPAPIPPPPVVDSAVDGAGSLDDLADCGADEESCDLVWDADSQ